MRRYALARQPIAHNRGPRWKVAELAVRFGVDARSLKMTIRHDPTAPKGDDLNGSKATLYYDLAEMDKWWNSRKFQT